FAWNRVSVPISQGVIADSGFYVSFSTADSNVWLLGESAIPISGQSYEIIDGVWAQHRNNRVLDPWIRVIVDISNAFIPGAIKGIPELDAFEVYPNPAQDQVQLKLEFSRPMPVSIKLLDIQGRKHRLDTFPYLQSFEQTLDLSHLPPGVYFLQVLTPQGQKSKKIILR
ncbi:MAG: T9SS C-terminal target domain-containing protein, partial [Bacteroidetes bacterium]